jgi:hypothetical protein
MIWRTRAEHAAEEAAPPPEAEGQVLVDALRAQVTLMRAWAIDEQQKREAAEDARLEARSRAAELGNALAFARSVIKSGEPWTSTCEVLIDGALKR